MQTEDEAKSPAQASCGTDTWHHCPTRADGSPVRIAHLIDVGTCQSRQRGQYHKCFSCSFQNGRAEQQARKQSIQAQPGLLIPRPNPAQVG